MTKEKLPLFKMKIDSFAKRRGASKMLIITCAHCNHYVISYQKDGPGPLLRCYLDRIHHPEHLKNRQYETFDKKSSAKLKCESCTAVIGIPIVYEKENRPAYLMRPGFFSIKKYK